MATPTPGRRLRLALEAEQPLQIPGAFDPPSALLLRAAGFRALYISGSGVATIGHGLPDLGMTSLTEVAAYTRRLTAAVPDVPFLVDADTGFGHELAIDRTVRELIHAGAAGMHLEDQEAAKRCGHRPNKRVVATDEMVARIEAANRARRETDPDFLLMARTDAFASEGLEATIARCRAYVDAGADALFPEALRTLEDFRAVCAAVGNVPVLANITEFGRTPLFTRDQLKGAGVRIVLYPLTMFRLAMGAMRKGAERLRADGGQEAFLREMMTREEVYQLIGYHEYEKRLDQTK